MIIRRVATDMRLIAGLPAPRQLILDEGTDLNDFYGRTKGGI